MAKKYNENKEMYVKSITSNSVNGQKSIQYRHLRSKIIFQLLNLQAFLCNKMYKKWHHRQFCKWLKQDYFSLVDRAAARVSSCFLAVRFLVGRDLRILVADLLPLSRTSWTLTSQFIVCFFNNFCCIYFCLPRIKACGQHREVILKST